MQDSSTPQVSVSFGSISTTKFHKVVYFDSKRLILIASIKKAPLFFIGSVSAEINYHLFAIHYISAQPAVPKLLSFMRAELYSAITSLRISITITV